MKALLDTSVLVAAHLPTHPFYAEARDWIASAKRGAYELTVSAHSLAETYSVLTRLPVKPPISPTAAWQFIEQNIVSCAVFVALTADDYQAAIKHVVQLGLIGGVVHDAVIAKAGELAGLTIGSRSTSPISKRSGRVRRRASFRHKRWRRLSR